MRYPSLPVMAACVMAAFSPLYSQNNTEVNNKGASLNTISRMAKNGEYDAALSELNAIIHQSNDSRAYKLRGHINFALKRYNDALADFNKVIELAPESANALVDRAGVYYVLEDYDNALADVDKALEQRPNSAFALLLRESIMDAKKPPKAPSFRARKKGESLKK